MPRKAIDNLSLGEVLARSVCRRRWGRRRSCRGQPRKAQEGGSAVKRRDDAEAFGGVVQAEPDDEHEGERDIAGGGGVSDRQTLRRSCAVRSRWRSSPRAGPAPATQEDVASSPTMAAPGPRTAPLGRWLWERSNHTSPSKPIPNVVVRTAPRVSAPPISWWPKASSIGFQAWVSTSHSRKTRMPIAIAFNAAFVRGSRDRSCLPAGRGRW